jgi:N-acetylglucosaminyldiphosphoundecaprenol N-acetyl-beta-D-mannosaminyltransferase
MQNASRSRSADESSALVDIGACKNFLGVPVSSLTLAQTIAAADQAMQSGQVLRHVCINVAKFVAMRSNPELDRDVRSSHIVSVDGMGIVWGARLFGIEVPERVTGVDLMEGVLSLCATKGYRPYFLGGSPDVVQKAVSNTQARYTTLAFAGWRDGYFKAEEEIGMVAAIRSSGADCLFIGMPTPQKERFLARHLDALGVPFIMGVGGGLDVLAGRVRRAPRFVQDVGLEWLFRTIQEPRRLGPRYLKTNTAFAAILAKALFTNRSSAR